MSKCTYAGDKQIHTHTLGESVYEVEQLALGGRAVRYSKLVDTQYWKILETGRYSILEDTQYW